jgi:hypothetical protein
MQSKRHSTRLVWIAAGWICFKDGIVETKRCWFVQLQSFLKDYVPLFEEGISP